MEMDPTLRAAILVALLIGLSLIVYFELRHMRKKKKPKIDIELMRDEAHNSIVTAKAVAKVLRERGRDTTKAEQLIFRAENAYTRREYNNSKQLANEAKRELEKPKIKQQDDIENTFDDILQGKEKAEEEEPETKTLFEEEKELPENYLQSKFMIRNVEREIEKAVIEGLSTSDAENLLDDAKRYFDLKDYGSALRYACRADKSLSLSGTEFIEIPKQTKDKIEQIIEEGIEEELMEEAVSEIAEEIICSQCSSALEDDDRFCGKCGAKVVKERKCPSCGGRLREDDRFCRTCGASVV